MNNNRITILYLIDTYLHHPGQPAVGGTEKQLSLLASSLNPEVFKSIVVQLGPHSTENTTDTIGNVKLFHFPTKKFYSLHGMNQIRKISKLAKDEKVDIIHTFFEKSEVMGWVTARLAKVPVWITSRRDLGFKRKEVYKKIFGFASKDCDRCIANCHEIKIQMVKQKELPEEKIKVIYNGLDLSTYQVSYDDRTLRNELGIDGNIPLVGMIANFNFEIKGHRFFIKAAQRVTEAVPDVEFILVGDGDLRYCMEKLGEELSVRQKIHFLGKRTDISHVLSALDISVLCSTSEGLSNVILESMAAAKPVVATRVGGSPEMVIDGITGYVVPPADSEALAHAIVSLLQNPDKAVSMGLTAQELVSKQFTIEAMVEKYERLYLSLMSGIHASMH